MEYIGEFMSLVVRFLRIPIPMFGFQISLWGVFLFSIVSSICGMFIGRIFK